MLQECIRLALNFPHSDAQDSDEKIDASVVRMFLEAFNIDGVEYEQVNFEVERRQIGMGTSCQEKSSWMAVYKPVQVNNQFATYITILLYAKLACILFALVSLHPIIIILYFVHV